jgi:hypothetical protein
MECKDLTTDVGQQLLLVEKHELEIRKTEIAEVQATALKAIADFITGSGLAKTLGAVSQAGAASSLLQGLTTHSGRAGLDARTQGQDALEICHLVQKVFAQFEEKLSAKANGEVTDEEIHDGEEGFKKWKEKVKDDTNS